MDLSCTVLQIKPNLFFLFCWSLENVWIKLWFKMFLVEQFFFHSHFVETFFVHIHAFLLDFLLFNHSNLTNLFFDWIFRRKNIFNVKLIQKFVLLYFGFGGFRGFLYFFGFRNCSVCWQWNFGLKLDLIFDFQEDIIKGFFKLSFVSWFKVFEKEVLLWIFVSLQLFYDKRGIFLIRT